MILIYTDGGSRGNPGKSACSFVVVKSEKIIYEESKFLGIATNNEAEYSAILASLRWLKQTSYKNEEVELISDSELVIRQLLGVYKIKKEHLLNLNNKVRTLINENKIKINFSHAKREEFYISRADLLVNQELDKH